MIGPKGIIGVILADKDSKGLKFKVTVATPNKPAKPPPQPKAIDWEWKMILRNTTRLQYEKLAADSFLDGLMEISNG